MDKLAFVPVETSRPQGVTLQQFGFLSFRIPASKKSVDVTIRLDAPFANADYCLVAMTNRMGCHVSFKYGNRTSAVVTVFRNRSGQEEKGVIQWIAVGEKGGTITGEMREYFEQELEENDLLEALEEDGEIAQEELSAEDKDEEENAVLDVHDDGEHESNGDADQEFADEDAIESRRAAQRHRNKGRNREELTISEEIDEDYED